MKPGPLFYLLCLLISILPAGCSDTKPVPQTPLSDVHQKFLQLCREEYKLNVILKPLTRTVWVYAPLQESLMEIAASPKPALKSNEPALKPAVKFIDASFKDGNFLVKYDIAQQKIYPNPSGYNFEYTEAYRKISRNILTAVSRVYFSVDKTGADSAEVPDFFIVVITDIRRGMEIRNTFSLNDLKRYMSMESIPQEEYAQRNLFEVKGGQDFIGDSEGLHLDYEEITLPEFLGRQIIQRVNFKYQQSSFPPSDDTKTEILQIAARTLDYYGFTDFTSLHLRDLSAGSLETIPQSDLRNYLQEDGADSKGRLIHIHFQ